MKNFDITASLMKNMLISRYNNNDIIGFNELVEKYPEFKKIDMFVKIAEAAYNNFKKSKYCTFTVPEDDFFSLIDCTFKGYSDMLYIMSEDEDICMFPMIMYDHSCMLYIEVPKEFDDNPEMFKDEFIHDAILAIAENYVTVQEEDEQGLTGKTLPNPDYIPEDVID